MSARNLNDKRTVFGWVMYDWANSAYFLVISTAIFPIYYAAVAPDTLNILGRDVTNSTIYAYAISFAYILVAIIVPLLSGIADYGGRRKFFLRLFTWLGSLACIGLFFFSTGSLIWYGTILFILSTIGAGAGIAFYNAYLPEIVSEDQYDRVSARGYSYGYFGSVLLLVFSLLMIQKPEWFGFADAAVPTRLAFALVGFWWLGFAQITFVRLPPDVPRATRGLVRKGFQELNAVWKKLQQMPRAVRFLVAFLFYMGGVQTVIYLATIFASVELEMESGELILVVLILQIVAILGAILFAWVSKMFGNKVSLLAQIIIWMLICIGAYFVQAKIEFYIIAAFVGMVLGGIQSLSRATYAKFLDAESGDLTSYFSFYDVMMKVSTVGGAFIFGFVEQLTGGMRNSVLALTILFAVGGLLLFTIDMRDMREQD